MRHRTQARSRFAAVSYSEARPMHTRRSIVATACCAHWRSVLLVPMAFTLALVSLSTPLNKVAGLQ